MAAVRGREAAVRREDRRRDEARGAAPGHAAAPAGGPGAEGGLRAGAQRTLAARDRRRAAGRLFQCRRSRGRRRRAAARGRVRRCAACGHLSRSGVRARSASRPKSVRGTPPRRRRDAGADPLDVRSSTATPAVSARRVAAAPQLHDRRVSATKSFTPPRGTATGAGTTARRASASACSPGVAMCGIRPVPSDAELEAPLRFDRNGDRTLDWQSVWQRSREQHSPRPHAQRTLDALRGASPRAGRVAEGKLRAPPEADVFGRLRRRRRAAAGGARARQRRGRGGVRGGLCAARGRLRSATRSRF